MMNKLARSSILIIAILFGGASFDTVQYEALPESRLWIDGTSSVGSYQCISDRVVGLGQLEDGRHTSVRVDVAVPVRSFNCGPRQFDIDFANALKADAHPALSFSLHRADWPPGSFSDGTWVSMSVTGEFEVAGEARNIAFTVQGQRLASGQVRVRGAHRLRMTDFGIEPPSRLLGLVRSHDEIVVRFDLRAAPR
ncbi:MAG: YceI family protein [Bacteroidetes bacterium]|nr:YceI family protein [Bacteroidota bacterium]